MCKRWSTDPRFHDLQPEALWFCLVRRGFRPVPKIFLSLHNTERISMKFARCIGLITTMIRLIYYIFERNWNKNNGEKIWTDVNRFCRDVKQVLTPSEWIHKFHCRDDGKCDREHNFTLIKDFTYKFYINILRILQQYFSSIELLYNLFQQLIQTPSFVYSFTALFSCRGNVSTQKIYNWCQTNAAAEASYKRARCLPLWF